MRKIPRLLLIGAPSADRLADQTLLTGAGFEVVLAESTEAAAEHLAPLPELVVLGSLPRAEVLDTLDALKSADDDFVPVAVIAAGNEAAERVAFLQAGADEVVSRPFDPAEWLARIRTLLRLKATHDRIREVQLDLERRAVSDPLTGLYNRRALHERLKQEFERFGRYRQPFALAMLDLDGFKPVNDQFGHLIGDRVLYGVAEAILRSIRALDVAARYGGDEFALVFPQTDPAGAVRVCERILKNVAAVQLSLETGVAKVTASMGLVFSSDAPLTTPEDLLREADDALYRAKRLGKNRLCAVRSIDPIVSSA